MCPNIWESLKGRVTFWIRQNNNRRSDGKQGGHVFIFINGQKCKMCTGSKVNKRFDHLNKLLFIDEIVNRSTLVIGTLNNNIFMYTYLENSFKISKS